MSCIEKDNLNKIKIINYSKIKYLSNTCHLKNLFKVTFRCKVKSTRSLLVFIAYNYFSYLFLLNGIMKLFFNLLNYFLT